MLRYLNCAAYVEGAQALEGLAPGGKRGQARACDHVRRCLRFLLLCGQKPTDVCGLPFRMGKLPVRLREVVYTVSPFEVSVLSGLWKDMPNKISKKVKEVSELGVLAGQAQRISALCVCVVAWEVGSLL